MKTIKLKDKDNFENTRLDIFLTKFLKDFSRSEIQKKIKNNQILVNKKPVKSSYILSIGDELNFKDVDSVKETGLKSKKFDLSVLYEDKDILVINKPAGITVHPTKNSSEFTIVNFILNYLKTGEKWPDPLRPGIVHRLDKETSGALLIAKNLKSMEFLIKQFKERRVDKKYYALVRGKLKYQSGIINSPIARSSHNRKKMSVSSEATAKEAVSKFKLKKMYRFNSEDYSFMEVDIKTGRTHQIRVHFKALKHPVVGDKVYGATSINKLFRERFDLNRQFLHAFYLRFKNMKGEKIIVKCNPPGDLQFVLDGMN